MSEIFLHILTESRLNSSPPLVFSNALKNLSQHVVFTLVLQAVYKCVMRLGGIKYALNEAFT